MGIADYNGDNQQPFLMHLEITVNLTKLVIKISIGEFIMILTSNLLLQASP